METRRKFIQKGLLGVSAATVMSTSAVQAFSGASTANASEDRFALGIAGYSFVHFDIDESLAMMKRMDVHFLCIKDFHLPLARTEAEIAGFHAQLAASGVTGSAVGPLYMPKSRTDLVHANRKRL